MITIRNTTTGASTRELDNQPGRAKGLGSSKGMPGRLQDNTGFLSANLDVGYDLSASLRLVALSSFQKLNRTSLQDVNGEPFEGLVQNPKGTIDSQERKSTRLNSRHSCESRLPPSAHKTKQ